MHKDVYPFITYCSDLFILFIKLDIHIVLTYGENAVFVSVCNLFAG